MPDKIDGRQADQAQADLLQAAVQWAITHPAESIEEAETIGLRSFGDTAIPVAGPGAPLVAEFSLAEFAATIALPTEAGKDVGHALELRYRLPRLAKRVVRGGRRLESPPDRLRRTAHLLIEAARYVDRHACSVAHKAAPARSTGFGGSHRPAHARGSRRTPPRRLLPRPSTTTAS